MKYSFMTFSTPELNIEENLALAKRLGYDGIEPRVVSNHKHGIELDLSSADRAAVRAKVEQSGVALSCIATSCKYATPETSRDMAAETRQYIDLAADVGCPCIRVFGGAIPANVTREQAVELLVKALGSVADHAAERGVTVCLETHDDWCDPRHVAEVMQRIDHPAIAVNWDLMHPVNRGGVSMDKAFEVLRPWIRHVHAHDGKRIGEAIELVPIGEGFIDHKRALELLASI
ncbi:MAG TPA: sugar phosphate isomerase/epimerase, partial [Candidatus Hydrogenedentes bacterium]|nr:sugar phosphate isomerase/epimerase [Candidatus Hydrogenedentota bacterium]